MKINKQTIKKEYKSWLLVAFLTIVSILYLFPYIWMISSSFKPMGEIFSTGINIIPENPTIDSYVRLLTDTHFLVWFRNSLIFVIGFLFFGLLLTSLAGYAFAKFTFKFDNFLFLLIIAGLMFPLHVQLVPLFIILAEIGWLNRFIGLIIPVVPHPFGVFFMRQYMKGISDDLIDAARVDGATELGIFFRIILPLSKPVLAAVSIYFGVFAWNQLLWPLIVMRSTRMFTLTVGITTFIGQYRPQFDMVMAASFLTTLPLILLFVKMQQQFISGLTAGSIKG